MPDPLERFVRGEIAFLSLIAERMHTDSAEDFESFAAANPDLMDKSAVARCYPTERLALDVARPHVYLARPRAMTG